MKKNLLGLVLVLAITNSVFADCEDTIAECVMHTVVFPLEIIPGGTIKEGGYDRSVDLASKMFVRWGPVPVFAFAIGSRLLVLGGATAGIIAAVKYYKKKKQTNAIDEQSFQLADQSLKENGLLQHHEQMNSEEEIV